MLRIILVFFATILTLGSARAEILLKSPSACLQLDVASSANGIELSLISKEDTLALSKITTFTFADGPWTGNQYSIISKASKNDYWKPVYGERRLVHNHYTEAVLWLSNQEYPGRSLELNCRLYDEGLAFKYEFRQIGETSPILFQEGTQFCFASDCYAWITDRAQAAYRKDRISTIKNACERPLVIELEKLVWLIIPG